MIVALVVLCWHSWTLWTTEYVDLERTCLRTAHPHFLSDKGREGHVHAPVMFSLQRPGQELCNTAKQRAPAERV